MSGFFEAITTWAIYMNTDLGTHVGSKTTQPTLLNNQCIYMMQNTNIPGIGNQHPVLVVIITQSKCPCRIRGCSAAASGGDIGESTATIGTDPFSLKGEGARKGG